MEKQVLDYVMEKARELEDAPTCCGTLRAEAEAWLHAVGTDREKDETAAFLRELEADLVPIDGLIALAESETGAQIFGADAAKGVAEHAKKIKADGAKYCDCPACQAVEAILAKKEEMLK